MILFTQSNGLVEHFISGVKQAVRMTVVECRPRMWRVG